MSKLFEPGCYILVIHPNLTFDASDRCYKKRADAEQEKQRVLAQRSDAIVFIHRARSADELKAKRLSRLCVVSHRGRSSRTLGLPAW